MSADSNNSIQSNAEDGNTSGFFIDDYSHLRLSYHRDFDDSLDITNSSGASQQEEVETVKEDEEAIKRKKLREYWISQMPDLPHPAVTMASIISSASKKMGMVQLVYNDRIEQGPSKPKSQEERFSPSRRSTMNCKKLP